MSHLGERNVKRTFEECFDRIYDGNDVVEMLVELFNRKAFSDIDMG